MMGMKMPPARAVVEGMAGARQASATLSPYARPSVLLPQAATNRLATRSPSPVFWKPCMPAGHDLGTCDANHNMVPDLDEEASSNLDSED